MKIIGKWLEGYANITLVLLGTLIILDGRIGIQVSPLAEMRYFDSLTGLPAHIGWIILWFGMDGIVAHGEATPFLMLKLLRLLEPILKPVLVNILGEARITKITQKFQKIEKEELKIKLSDTHGHETCDDCGCLLMVNIEGEDKNTYYYCPICKTLEVEETK